MRVLAAGLAVSCAPAVPLEDTPIEGATPELRARLRAELEAFERAIGPGRVTLRRIRVVDEIRGWEDVAGAYRDRQVWLTAGDPHPTYTLRHELCHAVHQQERLLRGPDPLIDTVAAGLFTSAPGYAESIRGHYRTARRQRREAMAAFCELGPTALGAMTDPCPGEVPLAAEVARWMLRHVYTAYEAPAPVASDASAVVTLDAWSPLVPVVSGTDAPGVVLVRSGVGDDPGRAYALADGHPTDGVVEAVPSSVSPPPLRGVHVATEVGWPEGPAAASGAVYLHHLGFSASRVWVAAQAGTTCPAGCWAVVEGSCDEEDLDQLFTADGRVYRAWTDGLSLRWAPL